MRLILIFGLAAALMSCGKKDSAEPAPVPTTSASAPTVPNQLTLEISTDTLGTSQGLSDPGFVGLYHTLAITVIKLTNLAMAVQLAVPVAAVAKALTTTPTYQGDDTWLWSYTFNQSGTTTPTYTAELTGKQSGANATWSFAVTKEPLDSANCCTKFVWLTGTSTGSTAGTWTINDHTTPTTVTKNRTLAWTFTSATDRTLKLTADKVDATATNAGWVAGGFVNYVSTAAAITMTVDKDPSNAAKTEVIWNPSTKEGSLLNEEGTKVCWDTALVNTTCK